MMPPKKAALRAERRSTARADAHLSMRVEGPPADDEVLTHIVTESENISASGVYCLSPHYVAPLSKVALTIVLPTVSGRGSAQRLLKCEGVVVRCLATPTTAKERCYQMACSFLGLEDGERQLLDDYVTWRNLQLLRQAATPVRRAATARKAKTRAVANGHSRRATKRPARNGRARANPRSRRAAS
jgi:hypothetical protein